MRRERISRAFPGSACRCVPEQTAQQQCDGSSWSLYNLHGLAMYRVAIKNMPCMLRFDFYRQGASPGMRPW
jgi:hypothetical protein